MDLRVIPLNAILPYVSMFGEMLGRIHEMSVARFLGLPCFFRSFDRNERQDEPEVLDVFLSSCTSTSSILTSFSVILLVLLHDTTCYKKLTLRNREFSNGKKIK